MPLYAHDLSEQELSDDTCRGGFADESPDDRARVSGSELEGVGDAVRCGLAEVVGAFGVFSVIPEHRCTWQWTHGYGWQIALQSWHLVVICHDGNSYVGEGRNLSDAIEAVKEQVKAA